MLRIYSVGVAMGLFAGFHYERLGMPEWLFAVIFVVLCVLAFLDGRNILKGDIDGR